MGPVAVMHIPKAVGGRTKTSDGFAGMRILTCGGMAAHSKIVPQRWQDGRRPARSRRARVKCCAHEASPYLESINETVQELLPLLRAAAPPVAPSTEQQSTSLKKP